MILVTGANGQIGVDLVQELATLYGGEQIVASDLQAPTSDLPTAVRFEELDICRHARLDELVSKYTFHTVYHLAGILSANGEKHPELCWEVNVDGLRNVLQTCSRESLRLFWPSSIAVFGPNTVRENAPQSAATDPDTMYGISKITGERLCKYYADHRGLDVRSIRFPGVISYSAPPGGGTTDFAVAMFIEALKHDTYDCFVTSETRLPMMYMPDAIKSIVDLMKAPSESISVRSSYNVTAFSFSAGELAEAIGNYVPSFRCEFNPDFRQEIADTWPKSIDDSIARADWDWSPEYNLDDMVRDMLEHVSESLGIELSLE